MKTLISFSDDLTNSIEKTLPIVKLTKSKNEKQEQQLLSL